MLPKPCKRPSTLVGRGSRVISHERGRGRERIWAFWCSAFEYVTKGNMGSLIFFSLPPPPLRAAPPPGGVGARCARRRRAVGGAMAANFSDYSGDGDDRSSGTSFPVKTDSGMVFRIVRQLCPHTLIVRPKYPWLSVNSLVFSLRHWSLTVFTTLPSRLRYFSINGILEKSNYTSYRIRFLLYSIHNIRGASRGGSSTSFDIKTLPSPVLDKWS
uniref:Uncharacterized protein n=1 Tax=Morchella brunnea TaxID=1174671 RepID=A0A8K1I7C6_9PEZI|nr:hypothetical protein LK370_mgp014 [Morchella brunnea]UBU98412.1 hypothetical protein [Morchella brunnea]